jgi:hypothetical protein
MTASGFHAPKRPRAVRALNASWQALARIGIGRVSLDEHSLIAAARRSCGLHHFADESFREPLRRMLASLEGEAHLHPLGRMTMRQTVIRSLATRLRMEQLRDLHPEIDRTPVESPVFIVGLQRTGTTLLHRLLDREPSLRALLSWEALSPVPPAAAQRPGDRDPRIRTAEFAERALRTIAPEFFAIHPVEAHAPEEDVLLMDLSFLSPTVDATLRAPTYSSWFWETDQTPAYEMLKRAVQLLLWQRPGRYLGKTPHHLHQLDVLLDVFPDAKIIQTHRDPVRVAASYCSMMSHGRLVFSDDVDPNEVGRQLCSGAVHGVHRAMEVRDRRAAGAFLDVSYADLIRDPIGEVRRIFEFLGIDPSTATLDGMRHWLARNPQNKHGTHRYRLEDFGIDATQLSKDFDLYRTRYKIPEEPGDVG